MLRQIQTSAAKTPRTDNAKTPRGSNAPVKPTTAPPPGRPRRQHLSPRKGNALAKEASWKRSPCLIPADCKANESKVNPTATVLDSGFPYVDIIQRQDAQAKAHRPDDYDTPGPAIQSRKVAKRFEPRRKARRKSLAPMRTAGFQTFSLDVAVDKAEAYYQHKLKDNPADAEVLKGYAGWLHSEGRLVEAERVFKKVLLHERRDVEAICAYAALLWECGKPSRAEDMYRMALTFEPQHLRSLVNYGLVLFSKGEFGNALQRFRKAVEADPRNEEALLGVAVCLEKIGRTEHEEIDALYRELLALNPASFDALHSYAQFLKNKEGNMSEAQECYQRALSLRPDDVEALCSFGVLLTEAAHLDPAAFARAHACFQHALALQPRHPATLYSYAVLLSAWHRAEPPQHTHHRPSPSPPPPPKPSIVAAPPPAAPAAPSGLPPPPLPPPSPSLVSPWGRGLGGFLSSDSPRASTPLLSPAALGAGPVIEAPPTPSSSAATPASPDPQAPALPPSPEAPRPPPAHPIPSNGPHPPPSIPPGAAQTRHPTAKGHPSLSAWPQSPDASVPMPHPTVISTSRPAPALLPPLSDAAPRPPSSARPETGDAISLHLPARRRPTPGGASSVGERGPALVDGAQELSAASEGRPSVAETEAVFQKVVEALPADADALCSYAIFLHRVRAAAGGASERKGAAAEAEKLYRRALKANPAHELAASGYADVRAELGKRETVGGARTAGRPGPAGRA